ncbi:hypothetical protein BJ878DRAFT_188428 [Calycina marina]|uniref:Histone-lysine N-methyltransferase, H3 lysine-36 specific n=1 Tax=Calycina marina TaxID=1763456 RepID=A0A9P8CCZ6_9HELO|nr:hypothetical protein BJ878DRAFT_188428 [Calycina marina]
MADDTRDTRPAVIDHVLSEMKLEEETAPGDGAVASKNDTPAHTPGSIHIKRSDSSRPESLEGSHKSRSSSEEPKPNGLKEEDTIDAEITVTGDAGKPLTLSRKPTQRIVPREPLLFNDLQDSTEEATSVFQVIRECIYGSKYMGSSGEIEDSGCDCYEGRRDGENHACDEESDCINRAMKMECIDDDCHCGAGCQNQRFQQKQYADVSVIKTDKKGYGLRANVDLKADTFIFEYIGEVINEPTFRRRTIQYDEEGIKHFYFMSLTKNEFVDATKKGNLGRFCNHSCNPNCYVDKWVVGGKLRMGIFAERHIRAGEELVFDYNVDRYGADPQPCYCAEPNCTGFIGGKTQTERATKLSHATIEALGIDDGDGWDTAVAKKPRKKKTGENDEEYVNNVQPRGLDVEGVRKVMAILMQCKEKWIAVKLLDRIQRCDDDRVRNRVVQMHGYQILRTTLSTWKDDNNVVLQVLDILYKFPRLTRNKISDSKIEATITEFADSEHEDVAFESKRLIDAWGKLEVAYRIPRKKFDPTVTSVYERRNAEPPRVVEKSVARAIVAPTGPRGGVHPQRVAFMPSRPAPPRRPFNTLPPGWFVADANGTPYYYSKTGQTQWTKPTVPAAEPPPPPKQLLQSVQTAKMLQDIINDVVKTGPATPTQSVPQSTASTPVTKEPKQPVEKWRTYPREKQMTIYEKTLSVHVIYVMNKYKGKLTKEELKKFAKEITKKVVASDYKRGRVDNPEKVDEHRIREVKKYVKGFFDKAVSKKKEREQKIRERAKKDRAVNGGSLKTESTSGAVSEETTSPAGDLEIPEDDEDVSSPLVAPASPSMSTELADSFDLKRKREDCDESSPADSESKRLKEETPGSEDTLPPPPPPPPPADSLPGEGQEDVYPIAEVKGETVEERELREQEEALMQENEESMAMAMDGSLKVEEREIENHKAAALNNNINITGHANGLRDGPGGGDDEEPLNQERKGVLSN